MITLTRHAVRRMRQRMGLPTRAAYRTAEVALRKGRNITEGMKSDYWVLGNQLGCGNRHCVKRYGDFYFIFRAESDRHWLITVIRPCPRKSTYYL